MKLKEFKEYTLLIGVISGLIGICTMILGYMLDPKFHLIMILVLPITFTFIYINSNDKILSRLYNVFFEVKNQIIFEKSYDGESLGDSFRDVSEAFNPKYNKEVEIIPQDTYGFQKGEFTIIIKWNPNGGIQ